MKTLINVLLRHRQNAIFAVLLATMVPLLLSVALPGDVFPDRMSAPGQFLGLLFGSLGWFTSVVMALVTLRHGPREGFYLLLLLALPSLWVLLNGNGSELTVTSFVLNNGMLWLLASVLSYSASWGMVIDIAAILGVFVVLCLHWIIPDIQSHWMSQFQETMVSIQQQYQSVPITADMLQNFARVFTGFKAMLYFFSVMSTLWIARHLQSKYFNPGGLRAEMGQVRCSVVAALMTVVVVFLQSRNIDWAVDAFFISIWPLVLTGLSLVHYKVRQYKHPLFVLTPMYIVMSLIPLFGGLVLGSVALVQVVLRFRPGQSDGQGNVTVNK